MRITCIEEAPKRMALRILDSNPIKSVYTEDNLTHKYIAFFWMSAQKNSVMSYSSLSVSFISTSPPSFTGDIMYVHTHDSNT